MVHDFLSVHQPMRLGATQNVPKMNFCWFLFFCLSHGLVHWGWLMGQRSWKEITLFVLCSLIYTIFLARGCILWPLLFLLSIQLSSSFVSLDFSRSSTDREVVDVAALLSLIGDSFASPRRRVF